MLLKSAIYPAIKTVAVRKNYGIEREGMSLPNLAIWRWEVKNLEWLSPSIQEKIKLRRKKREQAHKELEILINNIPEEERLSIFKAKKKRGLTVIPKEKSKNENKSLENTTKKTKAEDKLSSSLAISSPSKSKSTEKNEKQSNKESEKRKNIDQKQRSISGFFTPIKKRKIKEVIVPQTTEEKQNFEFEERFKSFFIKTDTHLAPTNYFKDIKNNLNFDGNLQNHNKNNEGN